MSLNVTITTYKGDEVECEGVLSDDGTVLAAAHCMPGRTSFQAERGKSSRTNVYGDVAVWTYDTKNDHPGVQIVTRCSWMVIQAKNKQGKIQDPFIRGPWDVRVTYSGETGSLRPITTTKIIQDTMVNAIRKCVGDALGKVQRGESLISSGGFADIAALALKITETISSRQTTGSSSESLADVTSDEGAESSTDMSPKNAMNAKALLG